MENCPLCKNTSPIIISNEFYECDVCKCIIRAKEFYLSHAKEKQRYLEHNNDVNDPGYQKFVSPITLAILRDYTPGHTGLDYGAGTGPVISKILQDNGYNIVQYDPFFHNFPQLLNSTYDYIACCEVIEHFHDPHKEFSLLKNLLKPGGRLYCMTEIYNSGIDFMKWYYKNDPTHVIFYRRETLEWIQQNFNFSKMTIQNRLIMFEES
jgi:SAM-dependent methyltransferase